MIGRTLNRRYKITEFLGKGAMGTVYRAVDTVTRQDVAVKIIASELAMDPEMLERFKREGEALRQLNHPNVVRFVDAFRWEGPNASGNSVSARLRGLFSQPADPTQPKRKIIADEYYVIVMEYIHGGSLFELLEKGPLSLERTRQLGLDLCDALTRAHRLNIVHRDIKPENILLDEDGTPKLADFGVARITAGTRMTRTGTQVGTPFYMAPEAWEGKPLDAQADIWSLGVVLFEMLSGQVPFDGDTGPVVMHKVLTTEPPDLKKLRDDAPPEMVQIVSRMLTRNKNERYQTTREAAVDLERVHFGSQATRIVSEREPEKAERAAAEKLAQEKAAHEKAARKEAAREKQEREIARQPKKAIPPRKPNTAIIVVLIGLAGAIGAALLGSPLLANRLERTPQAAVEFTPTESRTPAPSKTPIKALTPTPTPYPVEITDSRGIIMRLVPAGEFTMGSESGYSDEQPAHQVHLDAFYMDIYEVTNASYNACVNEGACDPPQNTRSYSRLSYYGNSEFDNYPVIYVDWNQASAYCAWRDASLPTEAQWEKAARGEDGRTYPWGEGISCNQANYHNGNNFCVGDTTEVGSYESGKSQYGMYDMAGNVWEWVSSLYQAYPYDANDGREDLTASGIRVLRGGSWGNVDSVVRSANRNDNAPVNFGDVVGFRCARSLP